MGKRSTFERQAGDAYPTPIEAVLPLIPHLRGVRNFAEPCAGDGALVRHLESFGLCCTYARDIATGQDALACDDFGGVPIITNPPLEARPAACVDWPFHAVCTVLLAVVRCQLGAHPPIPRPHPALLPHPPDRACALDSGFALYGQGRRELVTVRTSA